MVIMFASEKARQQLIDHGYVVTWRQHRRQIGNTYAYEGRGKPRIGRVFVEKIKDCELDLKMCLSEFIHNSGFETVIEWFEECRRFDTYRRDPRYGSLFGVTMLELD